MLEISTSGLMSGDGKRSGPFRAQPPRPSSTLLVRVWRSSTFRRGRLAVLIWGPEHSRSGAELLPVE
jgi:hypothetical protein